MKFLTKLSICSWGLSGGSSQIARQDRYERMLTQGHRSALGPSRLKDTKCAELKKEIINLLKDGKRMS